MKALVPISLSNKLFTSDKMKEGLEQIKDAYDQFVFIIETDYK
jgi:hypothetical protein